MSDKRHIPGGVVHDLPKDFEDALKLDSKALETWEDITPLARNEWICWVEIRQKDRDQAQAHRLGSLKPERRKAPSLLLAWLPSPLTGEKKGPPAIWRGGPRS